jgi:hypothetical protein
MSGLKELVESLDGTVLFGGMIVQFSDTTFEQAVKKIYEMGVEAEREECAKLCLSQRKYWDAEACADAIRARK